jgi:hypothetical protein
MKGNDQMKAQFESWIDRNPSLMMQLAIGIFNFGNTQLSSLTDPFMHFLQ